MANFTTVSDYVNKFEIHTNGVNTTKLTDYITRYEASYLVDLFGVELYNSWRADIDGGVPDPLNLFLFDPFYYQDCIILKSRGIKDMLLGFIYFEFLKDLKTQQTISGGVKIKGENSTKAGYTNVQQRYNESIDTYDAIRDYCIIKCSDYPTFLGVPKSFMIF